MNETISTPPTTNEPDPVFLDTDGILRIVFKGQRATDVAKIAQAMQVCEQVHKITADNPAKVFRF
jgi:hypothetical protein